VEVDVDVDVNFEVKDLCEWERKERKKMEGINIGGIFFLCVCASVGMCGMCDACGGMIVIVTTCWGVVDLYY